jgi:hypothetical protein
MASPLLVLRASCGGSRSGAGGNGAASAELADALGAGALGVAVAGAAALGPGAAVAVASAGAFGLLSQATARRSAHDQKDPDFDGMARESGRPA